MVLLKSFCVMKKLILLASISVSLLAKAQDQTVSQLKNESDKTIKKDPKDTINQVWKKGGIFSLNLSQGSLSNWAAGGDEFSLSLNAILSAYAFYKKDKHSWDNTVDINFGFLRTTSLGNRKNDDRFEVLSKYGVRIDTSNKIYLSGLFDFRTQFFDGYTYIVGDSGNLSSTFLSPAYLLLSVGLDFKPKDYLSVFVSPLTDTIYHVRVETTPGCFAEDSLRIHVNHAPSINLGTDKSFCDGDSLVLDAGPGFGSYNWSNGKTGQFIAVYNAGSYIVSATTQEGCKSADTMQVIAVFPNPKPDLGMDSIICAGTPRLVTAGTYAQYVWNTGSTASTIAITKTGLYAVVVTDKNNCKGYDSLVITKIINPPANFLPSDTSICAYGKLDLQPNANFDNYAWNTGASSAVITVASVGMYWLEIKDKNNCIGRDSIIVNSRDCMAGFYVPNAFTPGSDGKNDKFKPLIFGIVLQYEFTVYNRFGQIVFITRQPGQGWDGTISGKPQDSGGYVWMVQGTDYTGRTIFKKGVFVLVR